MIRGLYLVECTVADWPRSLAWYRDVLGLPLLLRDDAHAFALLQAGTGRVALKGGVPQAGTVMLTFEVDGLEAELRRLQERGVAIEAAEKSSPEGYRRAIIRDPDGYRLCLFEWRGTGVSASTLGGTP